MHNYVILIGRLTDNMKSTEKEITIAVNRDYKNKDGIYETDFIDIQLSVTMAANVGEYCRKGDLVGIQGRLETIIEEDKDGTKRKRTIVVADKMTFLSSRQSSASDND